MSIAEACLNAVGVVFWIEILVLGSTEALYYGKFISKPARNSVIFISIVKRVCFTSALVIFIFANYYFYTQNSLLGREILIVLIFGAICTRSPK